MSRLPFALRPGETIAWRAKPRYPKAGLPFAISLTVFVITLVYFSQPPSLWQILNGLVFLFGLLDLSYVYIFTKYASVSYYVTDRRVVRRQELGILSNVQEVPLSAIVRIRTRRWFRRGIIVFQSRDASTLTFANFSDDPVKVRQVTESAMLAGRQSVLSDF